MIEVTHCVKQIILKAQVNPVVVRNFAQKRHLVCFEKRFFNLRRGDFVLGEFLRFEFYPELGVFTAYDFNLVNSRNRGKQRTNGKFRQVSQLALASDI